MEAFLRIALIIAVFGFALWVPKLLHDHPVQRDLQRLEAGVVQLRMANDAVREENERHRTLVRGLREDPRVMDRRARETLGMSRDDEIIIWFTEQSGEMTFPR